MWHEWNANTGDVMVTWSALTENAERHTFKAPCCCFEKAPYTELAIV